METIKRLAIQFVKFGFVGGLCFVIDYGLLALLTELLGIDYLISSAISFTLSTLVNYILSMRFVFQGKEGISRTKEVTIFVVLSVIGLGFNQVLMWFGTTVLAIHYLITKIGATLMVMVYNFITRKLFLEQHKEDQKA
jgi:putative flippase GtrA